MSDRHPNVTNVDELEWEAGMTHGTRFASKTKHLAAKTAAKSIGCTLYEVDPGKRAFPMHAHMANEEAIYILEGEGTMRIGESQVPVRAGDYVAFPPGPQSAHQLINTSSAPLRYLCMSTMRGPEVALYPDSGKVGVRALSPAPMRLLFKRSTAAVSLADYFEGEDCADGDKEPKTSD
jgi:uncharacterized cupin superfamily protein